MKTLKSYFAFGLALLIAAVSLAYSLHTAARVRDLEQRLRIAEAAMRSQTSFLEARVQRDELAATQPRFIEINHAPFLGQQMGLDQQMNQRPEPPRLTPRHWEPSDLEQLGAPAPSDSVAAR